MVTKNSTIVTQTTTVICFTWSSTSILLIGSIPVLIFYLFNAFTPPTCKFLSLNKTQSHKSVIHTNFVHKNLFFWVLFLLGGGVVRGLWQFSIFSKIILFSIFNNPPSLPKHLQSYWCPSWMNEWAIWLADWVIIKAITGHWSGNECCYAYA